MAGRQQALKFIRIHFLHPHKYNRYNNDIMSLPAFFPQPRYMPTLPRTGALPLATLCETAGVPCAAAGAWTQRRIVLANGGAAPWIKAEPGDWGTVSIGVPASKTTPTARAQWALGALAYVMFDGVARASIAGAPWAKVERPTGPNPAAKRPQTNAERQRKFRQSQAH